MFRVLVKSFLHCKNGFSYIRRPILYIICFSNNGTFGDSMFTGADSLRARNKAMSNLVFWLRLAVMILLWVPLAAASGDDGVMVTPIHPLPTDVIATGNPWLSIPTIRASDGAVMNFNVLSMRDRGLLQVEGPNGDPSILPLASADGKPLRLENPSWELLEYWIPRATFLTSGARITVAYCAPAPSRAAFLVITFTNTSAQERSVSVGVHASFGRLSRVTYTPVELRGERVVGRAAWEKSAQVFAFVTNDTQFAWALDAYGSQSTVTSPPVSIAPSVDAIRTGVVGPGDSLSAYYVIGVGMEEYSASQSAAALRETIDRLGTDAVILDTAKSLIRRTRTTGRADLDSILNRNLLFTTFYAWGRSLDTEELVGVTSRSPRYYVSAAYWDRDAMLWSFPALLDSDPHLARDALIYALTTQARNAGIHSRFINGTVLEDGFELDEAVAPVFASLQYFARTGDRDFLAAHRAILQSLLDRLEPHYDASIGLYSTLQDAQDEYRKQPFSTYDNVLVWRTLTDWAATLEILQDAQGSAAAKARADRLRTAILRSCVSENASGARGTIFVSATGGIDPIFADVPPGSLMRLPALGFIAENDPLFIRTYAWLHSNNYLYSNAGLPFGLPGSYRLPFTTSWSVADHLALPQGRDQALKILLGSPWDGGIISEGVDPSSGVMDYDGRAFATAAGDVAHAICSAYCKP